MGKGGHVRINNGEIIEHENPRNRDIRKRLDDVSEDLSSIPSYDDEGRRERDDRDSELDREQMIFGDRD